MASTESPLWSVTLRKEAFDLMAAIWPALGEVGQERLASQILDGPPEPEIACAKENDTELFHRRRDRAVFERLEILHRIGPKLPAHAHAKLAELKLRYPDWEVQAGDETHFTVWTESSHGDESDYRVDELKRLSGLELLQTLREPGNKHDGRLDTWRRLVEERPGRAIGVLRMIATAPASNEAELWAQTLFGLRQAISRPIVARRLFDVLAKAPDHCLRARDVLSGACDLLEKASERDALAINERLFWQLWDRLFDNALSAGESSGPPEDDDWVHRAINRPIGDLTKALLNVMFRRSLQARKGLPDDLRPRFERLVVASDPDVLRLGRVILASRLHYLFAVDPAWMADRLIPFFDWGRSEDEAIALWCGYAWQPRIDADLWAVLKSSFFDAFTPARLARLGTSAKNIASLLMVAGVEFPSTETPADRAREAIHTMTPELRGAAAFWLYSYLAGPKSQEPQPEAAEVERAARADRLWHERVAPWLKRVWPRDRNLIERNTSEAFALLAIATREAFDDAVAMLQPFIGKTSRWDHAIHNLRNSIHPDVHAQSSLKLINCLVLFQSLWFADDLRAVLDRIATADANLREDAVFRSLDDALRAAGR